MKLTVKIQSIEKINSQALIIGLFEKTKTARSESKVEGLDQSISDMVSVDGFKAGLGEVTRVAPDGNVCPRIDFGRSGTTGKV